MSKVLKGPKTEDERIEYITGTRVANDIFRDYTSKNKQNKDIEKAMKKVEKGLKELGISDEIKKIVLSDTRTKYEPMYIPKV